MTYFGVNSHLNRIFKVWSDMSKIFCTVHILLSFHNENINLVIAHRDPFISAITKAHKTPCMDMLGSLPLARAEVPKLKSSVHVMKM